MLSKINMKLENIKNFFTLTMTVFLVTACHADDTPKAELPMIAFANGDTAQNCEDFNKLRSESKIAEDVNNHIIMANYLHCTLDDEALNAAKPYQVEASVLDTIANNLSVRQLPTSLSQTVAASDSFADAGFDINPDTSALVLSNDPDRIFTVELKDQLSDNSYLIWVSDQIKSGTYKAFYAAKVILNEDGTVVAQPFYDSGF